MARTLEEVLASWYENASVLRLHGHTAQAESITKLCDEVRSTAEDYITWLPESAARMRSGHTVAWLRSRFADWASQGHARMNGKTREYRQVVIPQRVHISAAAEEGRIAGEAARSKAS